MKKLILVSLLYLPMLVIAKPVVVSVSESIGARTDAEVRHSARVKAQWLAIDRLPIIISGKEQLINGEYSEEIMALTAGDADVNILMEQWDRKNGTLQIEAEVSLNNAKSLEMIDEIKQSKEAQIKLKQVYLKLNELTAMPLITGAEIVKNENERAKVLAGFLIRDSIKASKQATEELYTRIGAHLYRSGLSKYLAGVEVIMLNIDERKINFLITAKEDWLLIERNFKNEYKNNSTITHLWRDIENYLPKPCIKYIDRYYTDDIKSVIIDIPNSTWSIHSKSIATRVSAKEFKLSLDHYNNELLIKNSANLVKIIACTTPGVYEAANNI